MPSNISISNDFWLQHLERFDKSGLSQAAYCREQGLRPHQLTYYVGQRKKKKREGSPFARVVVPESTPTRAHSIRMTFGNTVFEIDAEIDPAWIARLAIHLGGKI